MTSSIESRFDFHELFFSKTDRKGLIRSGNTVFQRVSEYSWQELLGKPHNIIRHGDMPRGVFELFWDYLKAGKPIGAFVKNRSRTGKHYWVFALVMPAKDGFLSVRLKPGGALLQRIERIYAALCEREKSEKLSPQESRTILVKSLKDLGYWDYSSFMSAALLDQLKHRSLQLNRPVSSTVEAMLALKTSASQASSEAKQILNAYQKNQFVPLNLDALSYRLAAEGRQLSVVANQYKEMVRELHREIKGFESMSDQVGSQIEMGQFFIGASQLMREVMSYILAEPGQQASSETTQELKSLSDSYQRSSQQTTREIADVLARFRASCGTLENLVPGLELVRLTGKIEAARLKSSTDINTMLDALKDFQIVLASGLRRIVDGDTEMGQLIQRLQK